MSNTLVSVIIVTKGRNNYIRTCLDSVIIQTHSNLEVLVINNCPDDNFAKELTELYSRVKIYSVQKNLFYASSLNLGISYSKAEFILCLNDDTILDKDFIKEALNGFNVDSHIGMVSGKMLRLDRKTIDSTGLFLSPWRTAKERGYGIKDLGQLNKEGYIFGVNGAAAFYRKHMLDDIKIGSDYFDSDFHIFYEDLDIAWRANNLGWRGYYVPLALVYHARGGTVRENEGINKKYARFHLSDELNLYLIRNRYLAIIKNENLWGFLAHLPFSIAYNIWELMYLFVFRRKLIKRIVQETSIFKSAFVKRRLLQARIKENKR